MFIVGRTSKREYSRCFHLNEQSRLNRKMLFFAVVPLLLTAVSATDCYSETSSFCSTRSVNNNNSPADVSDSVECTAEYEDFRKSGTTLADLRGFTNANIGASYHILMMSSYFGNYYINREGFKKLYRQYSDELWADAIHVMKYIAKRAGSMNFKQPTHVHFKPDNTTSVESSEIHSLAKVLDMYKKLASDAYGIYSSALTVHGTKKHQDITTLHFIEEKFLEKYTERIWELATYHQELKELLHSNQYTSVNLFLFDEYLKKSS